MNHSLRCQSRRLFPTLITLVVIFAQITLPLGSLLAAGQPTPQMAREAAQQAGLGGWLADAAAGVIAAGQQLWGTPTVASAQTDTIRPTVTINQKSGQSDPAGTVPVLFTAVFSEPIDTATFTTSDINIGNSTAPGTTVNSMTQVAPNDGTTFEVSISATGPGTIEASIPSLSYTYSAGAIFASTGAFGGPFDLAKDSAGNLYVNNYNAGNVKKITPAGVVTTFGTTGGNPTGIVVDSADNVYVSNYASNTVTKITPAGVSSTLGTTGLRPVGITIDAAGNIYTANQTGGNVTKITPAGVSSVFATVGTNPFGIAIDPAGNLYVTNTGSNSVTKITPAGVATTHGSTGAGPTGIVLDEAGNVYTVNNTAGTITKITPAGVSSVLGSIGNGGNDITIDNLTGYVYVANSSDGTVSGVSTSGGASRLLGPTGASPTGILIDGAGNIYTTNRFDHNVTKFTATANGGVYDLAGNVNIASTSTDNSVTYNPALISNLNCAGATVTGTLTQDSAASSVSISVPYTGGNGGIYSAISISSTGVTGLTGAASAGAVASGAGNLVLNVTGTPTSAGTAAFALSLGGQSCTVNASVAGVPDLETTIGQPSPNFVAGIASNVPLTVSNNGTDPTTGTVTATMTLPANTSVPASFSSGAWSCTTSGQTVTCTNPGPVATGSSSTVQVPVTPGVATVGTQPGFNGSSSTPGETNTSNNNAVPMTPSVAVVAATPNITLAAQTPVVEGGNGSITATLTATASSNVTVTLAYTNGTASGADYTGATQIVIPTGQLSASVNFTPTDDAAVESAETVQIYISAVTGANDTSTPQTITINDNDLGSSVGPGGVTSTLQQWHKADASVFADMMGTTPATAGGNVLNWNNLAQNTYHPVDSAGGDPTYQAADATSNYYPSLFFNKNENDYLKFVGRVMPATSDLSLFVVGNIQSFNDDIYTVVGYGDNANDPALDIDVDGGIPYFDLWLDGSSPANNDTTFPVANNATYLMAFTAPNSVTDSVVKRVTGKAVASNMELTNNAENFDDFWIGSDGGGERWNGTVNEVVAYSSALTGTELTKVESYLAIKWGLTLDADPTNAASNYDYLNSAGTTIWAGNSTNSTYHNNVAGVGRDDAAALVQKQSQSVNTGQGITVTMGITTIAASNAANSNTFATNQSFLVWGNNSSAAALSASYNGGTNNRIARVWKVQETGTVGTVKVRIPVASAAGLQSLIVHTNNTFSSVDRAYPLTVVSSNYEADVNFNNNDFFTFSTDPATAAPDLTTTIGQPAPAFVAGVASNLPITVSNIGTGPTTSPITATMTLPANTSAPASFTSGAWSCTTSGQTVSCTQAGPIAAGDSSVIQMPVTPAVSTVGTTPGPFTGSVSTTGETNTGNNAASPMTPSAAVQAAGADTDNDGIQDASDDCQNTPASGVVDPATGCSYPTNLSLGKSANVTSVAVGVPFTYTLTVNNTGAEAHNVIVKDTVPAQLTIIGSPVASNGGVCTVNVQEVSCQWSIVPNGATRTATIQVQR